LVTCGSMRAGLVAVIVTPAIVAPEVSVTVPLILPVVKPCAQITEHETNKKRNIFKLALIGNTPFANSNDVSVKSNARPTRPGGYGARREGGERTGVWPPRLDTVETAHFSRVEHQERNHGLPNIKNVFPLTRWESLDYFH
jgi:hypothetical protein